VHVVQDKQGFQIKADIPGVAKEDIRLDVDHNVVTISAKRSSQTTNARQAAGDEAEAKVHFSAVLLMQTPAACSPHVYHSLLCAV
jgi:HSP20 family molecular chaperone IbpA